MIDKRIKISCSHTINHNKSINGTIWRDWKVQINSTERGHNSSLSHYIDYVEYILHESFKSPHIVSYEEPFTLQQEGWGEFDLGIVFHFRQRDIPSQTIMFDVNFLKPNYSEIKILRINTNSTNKNMNRKRAISSSSDSSSIAATPPDQDVFSLFDFLSYQKEQVFDNISKKRQKTYISNKHKHGRSTSHNNSFPNNNVVSEEIDIPKLATSLESLNDENLRKVYNIFLKFDRKNMFIIETKDLVIFDLYSLGVPLLKELWKFTTTLTNDSI